MTTEYVLRGLTKDGTEVFYTGRAGSGWVSEDRGEAFSYSTTNVARSKAILFNGREPLTGIWFLVLNATHGTAA